MSRFWNYGLLEELITDMGDVVTHEVGAKCPNCSASTDPYASMVEFQGRPAYINSLACEQCHGNGFIYRNARCINGLVTSVHQAQRDLMDAGYASPGDAVFSPSLNAGFIGDFDRITFSTTTQVDGGQVIMRGAATLNENATIRTDLLPTQDRLWYISECVLLLEDQNGVQYTSDTDFTITDKKITWINGPEVGTLYVIKYRAYMEWVVYASPQERFDQGRSLGQKVLLRKKHVHFLAGSQAETPQQRKVEQADFVTVKV